MALRLDGLSVTKPKGLNAGESDESLSLFLVWSWSELALAVTLALLLLLLPLMSQRVLDLGLREIVERGEEGGRRLRGRAQAIFWLWLLELGS